MTCSLGGDVCRCVPDARPLAISGSHARVEYTEDVTVHTDNFPIDRDRQVASDSFAASVDNDAGIYATTICCGSEG
jgi:hypothetical protein